jgi:type II secretory ATPase GspE/PulE/Tfp pilus assembly ATPase PilB-like protein
LCNLILTDAFKSGARGIRAVPVDAERGGMEYDIDGQWQPVMQVPVKVFTSIINRFKIMAVLDAGRVPVQEGELHIRLDGVLHVLKIRTDATRAAHELLTIILPADGAA